jgi:hypothetical protein
VSIGGFLKFLFFGLIPPEKPEGAPTPEICVKYQHAKKRWSYFVAGSLWIGFAALLALLLPTYGFSFGMWPERFDRVAWSADLNAQAVPIKQQVSEVEQQVNEVSKKTDRLLIKAVRDELRDTRRKQCRAVSAGDTERLADLAEDLELLQEEYRELHPRKDAWAVPPCNEL